MVKNDWFAIQPTQNERGRQKVRPPAKQYLSLFAYFFHRFIVVDAKTRYSPNNDQNGRICWWKLHKFVKNSHLPTNLNTKLRLSGSFSHLIHNSIHSSVPIRARHRNHVSLFIEKKEHTLRNKAKKIVWKSDWTFLMRLFHSVLLVFQFLVARSVKIMCVRLTLNIGLRLKYCIILYSLAVSD